MRTNNLNRYIGTNFIWRYSKFVKLMMRLLKILIDNRLRNNDINEGL